MLDLLAPPEIIGIEHDEDHLIVNSAGEMRAAYLVIMSEDTIGQIRAGYRCAVCYEGHSEAYPEKCNACSFPMKEKQSERVAKDYRGNIRCGPETDDESERAFMDEWEEIQRRKQLDEIVYKPSIWVPRDIS